MKTMGFLISHKNNERRRAIIPTDINKINTPSMLFFEKGYGNTLGFTDDDYRQYGVNICEREKIYNCDIITDVKLGDADYLDLIGENKILFGWAHAVQNVDFTSKALEKDFTIISWEEIYDNGRYIFYRNREIAGEAAVLHAFRYCGKMPYDCKVAIIGNGQTAKGALRILHGLGAEIDVYGRKHESLFKKNMFDYDVLINCVMWDTSRKDRIIYKDDLFKMKKGTLIIDISCDPNLEIETSHPTTIDNPVYTVEGIIHYAVDNTPAMYPITVSKILSKNIVPYVNCLIDEIENENLIHATVIKKGHIIQPQIRDFRIKRKLFCK